MNRMFKRCLAFLLVLALTITFALGQSSIFKPAVAKASTTVSPADEHVYIIAGYNKDNNITNDQGITMIGHTFCLDCKLGTPSGSSDEFRRYKLSEFDSVHKYYIGNDQDKTKVEYDRVYNDNKKLRILKLLVDYTGERNINKFIKNIDLETPYTYLVNEGYITDKTVEELVKNAKKEIGATSFYQNLVWAVVHDGDEEWEKFVNDDGTETFHSDNYQWREKGFWTYKSADPYNDPYSLWNVVYKPIIKYIDTELPDYFALGYDAWVYDGPDSVQSVLGAPFYVSKTTGVRIQKADGSGNKLSGARLQLLDNQENVLAEWISSDEMFTYTGLQYNETYIIRELETPNPNLCKAKDVLFYIDMADRVSLLSHNSASERSDADGYYIRVTDSNPSISVRKTDESGSSLKACGFVILDTDMNPVFNGEEVLRWESDSYYHYVEGLSLGVEYILHEEYAAEGYTCSADVHFMLDEYGDIIELNDNKNLNKSITVVDEKTKVSVSKVDIVSSEEIAGAQLQILDSEKNVVEEWTSTTTAHVVEGLKTGVTYTIKETVAPDGYTVTSETTFVIDRDGNVTTTATVDSDGVILVEDTKTKVSISKVDIADSEELAGAHIQILDSEKNVVEEWDSTTTAHVVEGLKTGVTYTLKETVAPDGYTVASEITFVIGEDGTVTTAATVDSDGVILVEDTKTKVSISKVDIANSEELEGAKLQILDSEKNVVEEWTSTTTPHEVEGLKTGVTYTLVEETAPEGFVVAESILFKIDSDGTVFVYDAQYASYNIVSDNIVMVDEHDVGSLMLKKSIDGLNITDEEKAGALTFTVQNSDGKYLDWDGSVSDEEKKITLDKFTKQDNGEYVLLLENIASGEYTIIETNSAIEGYILSSVSKTTDKVEVKFNEVTESELKDVYEIDMSLLEASVAATGDRGFTLELVLMALSLMTGLVIVKNKKRI